MKSPRKIVKEAIRKANSLGWVQTQMIFINEIKKFEEYKKTTKQPFMYLADIEKMILDIFEDEEIKNCMMLGVLK